jgi:pyruvate-formate lyase-activating enzyme
MNFNTFSGFHIEPTNVCVLKCPRCARTKFLENFGNKSWSTENLNLSDLKKFIDVDMNGKIVYLCGNYGDPIYSVDLINMACWFKSVGAHITIVTNGSKRKDGWWHELSSTLDYNDEIIFSVDGTPNNFTQYRINGDWNSIEQAMRIVADTDIKSTWSYIPFRYNENDIDEVKNLCENIGIKNFVISPSDRWDGDNDEFKPVNFIGRREHKIFEWKNGDDIIIDPKCKDNKRHFISASGYYMPCCFVGDHRFYYKSQFYKEKERFNIKTHTFTEVTENLGDFYDNVEISNHNYCTFNCPKI